MSKQINKPDYLSYSSEKLSKLLSEAELPNEFLDIIADIKEQATNILTSRGYEADAITSGKNLESIKKDGDLEPIVSLLTWCELVRKFVPNEKELKLKSTSHRIQKMSEQEKLSWYSNLINYYKLSTKSILNRPSARKFFNNDSPSAYLQKTIIDQTSNELSKLKANEKKFVFAAKLQEVISYIKEPIENNDYLSLGILISDATFYAEQASIQHLDHINFGNRKFGSKKYREYTGEYIYYTALLLMQTNAYENLNELSDAIFDELEISPVGKDRENISKRIHEYLTSLNINIFFPKNL